ncbi:MAG: hypothetical protein OXG03_05945 [Gammaproteobacteria bacterium]|nr:hypothetical protein [Gammaproteobacteria bacterium]
MTLYAVRCLSPQGATIPLAVDADSPDSARRHPAVAHRRVLSVRRHWKEWLGLRRVDLNEQRLLLAQMSMQLSRGSLTPEELDRVVAQLPTLLRNRHSRSAAGLAGLAPAELLLHLNVHPFAIALCREGERLGQVPDMLLQAAEFLDRQRQSREKLHAPLLRAGLYTVATLGLFALTPFLFQMLLDRLSGRVEIQTTLATDILMTLHALLTRYLPLTLGVVVIFAFAGYRFWSRIRTLPPLRDIDALVRGQRSSVLLAVLAPAFRKGVHLADLVRSLHPLLGKRASQYLYTRLRTGHSLSQSLSERYFSRTLAVGLYRFEDAPTAQLPHLFSAIQTNLHTEISWHLERTVRWTRWFYSGVVLTLMLLLVKGFLVPIYSISVQ